MSGMMLRCGVLAAECGPDFPTIRTEHTTRCNAKQGTAKYKQRRARRFILPQIAQRVLYLYWLGSCYSMHRPLYGFQTRSLATAICPSDPLFAIPTLSSIRESASRSHLVRCLHLVLPISSLRRPKMFIRDQHLGPANHRNCRMLQSGRRKR